MLLPGLSLSEAHSAVERLRLHVAAHPFPKVGFLTVSVGVALHRPSMTLDALLLWADRALYQAKELGRDRVVSEINPDAHQEKVNSEPLN